MIFKYHPNTIATILTIVAFGSVASYQYDNIFFIHPKPPSGSQFLKMSLGASATRCKGASAKSLRGRR